MLRIDGTETKRIFRPVRVHYGYSTRTHTRTFELQRVRCPALLEGHDVRHGLAAAADARDADGRSLEVGDVLVFGLYAGDDRPERSMRVSELRAWDSEQGEGRPIQRRGDVAADEFVCF